MFRQATMDKALANIPIATCSTTKKPICIGATIKFLDNDMYDAHTFKVCYSVRASKFYLEPSNFDAKPISFIQRYLACNSKVYSNEFEIVEED